jgi:vancomycin resistance protein VanW
MQSISPMLKASIRQGLKTSRNLWCGYALHYARNQLSAIAPEYCHLWSQCSTPIKQRSGIAEINENRLWNMQLTTERIDGLLLHPGEVFSFWNRVPAPRLAHGFRAGPMLVQGRLCTEVGGGLCQISTTLFNALLWANLQILERHNHSIDIHGSDRFFTLGQDAAVVYGYKDLMVRNKSQIGLQLQLQVFPETAQVVASVWGQQPMPVTVQVKSAILQELSPADRSGQSGWLVETVRSVAAIEADAETAVNYYIHDTYHPYVPVH